MSVYSCPTFYPTYIHLTTGRLFISKFITFICSYFELSCMQSPWVFCDTDDITNYINWQNIQSKCYMLVGVGDLLKVGLARAWLCWAGGWAIIFYRFGKLAAACVRDKQFVLKKSPCSSHAKCFNCVSSFSNISVHLHGLVNSIFQWKLSNFDANTTYMYRYLQSTVSFLHNYILNCQ